MKYALAALLLLVSACAPSSLPNFDAPEASSNEEKIIHVAALVVWASETATDRVLHFDTTDAPQVLKVMELFSSKLIEIDRKDEIWTATMMYEVGRIVTLAVEQRVRKRITDFPLTFLNVRRALDFSGKSIAIHADLTRLLENEELSEDQVWDILLKRLTHNIDRLRPFVNGGWVL